MRTGIVATLFFLFFIVLAFGETANTMALKPLLIQQDTTKKDKPKKTNANCNTIGNLTGNTCIGSTLTVSATDPIESVEWIFENNSSLLKQTNAPFIYKADVAGTYLVKIMTRAGCELNSNSITVTNLLVPTIVISTRSNIICAEYPNPFFTGVGTYNGDLATYQWKVNYINVGALVMNVSQPFSPPGLKKGDVITCEMTSTASCITAPVVQSDPIIIDDIPTENPSVSIEANTAKPCAGSELVYTALPVNGGDAPGYQWYINGVAAANGNAQVYKSTALKEGDELTCTMASDAKVCQAATIATSLPFPVHTIPSVTPEISIQPTAVEPDVSITYSATIKNGGTAPIYQWQINSVNVGTNSNTFTAYKLVPSDLITCILVSNADCTTKDMVASDPIVNNATIPFSPATANLFTPNGDGVNDTWAFPGVDAFRNSKVSVFNRNGQEVFHSTGFTERWDGKTNAGKACSSGVYYYFINLDSTQTKSGVVTIIR